MERQIMYSELIESLKREHPVTEGVVAHDQWDILHQFGCVPGALLYATLFCPEFVEIESSVILNRRGANLEERFLNAKRTNTLDLAELESSFNFLELPYVFADRRCMNGSADSLLARFVAEAWRARLELLYRPRRFEVGVLSPAQTGSVVGVHF